MPEVVWRAGVDLNPLGVADDGDVAWLVRGDLNDEIEAVVAAAPGDATVVVFHTAVLAYLEEAGRARFAATMGRLTTGHGVRWLGSEGRTVLPGVATTLPATLPAASGSADFALALDSQAIALAHPHGRALHWLG
ncbi:DUF2332 family protein [Cryobacterium sp. AP23]